MKKLIILLSVLLINACVWYIPEGKYKQTVPNITPPQKAKLFARITHKRGSHDIKQIELERLVEQSNLFEVAQTPKQADYILDIIMLPPEYKNYCGICNIASIVTLGVIPTYTSEVYIFESHLTDKKLNKLKKQTYYENVGEIVSITSVPAYLLNNNIDTWDYQYRAIDYNIIRHIINDAAVEIYDL